MAVGICNLSVVPLRASASHRSEIVSQVLFGESFEIVQHEKDWHLIRLMDVPYEGWIQHGQFIEITDGNCLPTKEESLIVDITGGQALCGQDAVDLLPGVKIAKWMIAGNQTEFPYTIQADLRRPTLADFDTEFPKLVDYYKNGPYLWGGRTRYGIDCSGLSQAIFSHFGISLQRDACQQAEQGTVVDFLSEIRPGDLAFFDNADGRITHVGIMLDMDTILHASAQVRIDNVDSEGILHRTWNKYTHKLRIVKRYF
ncbi:NlpC/P60 family protein [Sphingobacterium allocomposti]|uniref:NlpC/P60 family protein n=1 Tax=Sphingobacterium allocomposti TaxID=415956 RepID=A0A5S5DJB5_9SPHI|nr:SH3 domain-containing C40 family peptidase [Sphingobacterium composti Yoo et al. 2007 non Ten et al. 2007]TYP95714.1 NlpC/P60 family protein [Sphingobacterium composti Yoo et al. 2007 non Ten et al. 2007]